MGCDIHGVFQCHDSTTGLWEDVSSNYGQDRHYQLFAVLADVRNGYGFAGTKTGEYVEPISEPRGLPGDFEVDGDSHPLVSLAHMDPRRRKWFIQGEKLETSMGDHSHSWLTGEEMLAWFETAPQVQKVGVLSRKEYAKWDKVSPPESYCGAVMGMDVVVVDDNLVAMLETPNWTHVQVFWLAELKQELAYFFNEVKRLVEEHGKVRFVFGFDS